MAKRTDYDAVVVGSGPNGLAAAITLAREGCSVVVLEGKETVGGGTRSAEVTLPGFLHDVCSAIHPLGLGSPFFRDLPLTEYGVEWIHPTVPLAHPFDDGTAVAMHQSVAATAQSLGKDAGRYRALMGPIARSWKAVLREFLGPLRLPKHPIVMAGFGIPALFPARLLANLWFRGREARALFGGLAAHSIQPLERPATAAFGLMLGMLGHAVGWPLPRGGSQRIADAMTGYLQSLGGEVVTGHEVGSLDDLPPARAVLLDVTPRQLLRIGGSKLPSRYRQQLEQFRYGPGIFKLDLALAGPVPWRAALCRQAGTVHLGGTLKEIAASERDIARGEHPDNPYVIVAQQSLFDPTRAPEGKHTLWAYCHVPNGSTIDMTEPILRQVERFAPGFRDLILARHTTSATAFEAYNPNYVGGDINGGVQDLGQLFTRPVSSRNPYATPVEGLYLCSSSTPPGGGVHGMCGYFAAKAALRVTL